MKTKTQSAGAMTPAAFEGLRAHFKPEREGRALARTEIALRAPLGEGEAAVETLTLVEPVAQQMLRAEAYGAGDEMRQVAAMLAEAADLPLDQVLELGARDLKAASDWLAGLTAAADAEDPRDEDEVSRRFELLVPIPGNDGGTIDAATLREPTLRVLIDAQRAGGDMEQATAMLAGVAALPLDKVHQMGLRDFVRLQGWLGGFLGND